MPVGLSVQLEAPREPEPPAVKSTGPEGVVTAPESVSRTAAVQVLAVFTATGFGEHVNVVAVLLRWTSS